MCFLEVTWSGSSPRCWPTPESYRKPGCAPSRPGLLEHTQPQELWVPRSAAGTVVGVLGVAVPSTVLAKLLPLQASTEISVNPRLQRLHFAQWLKSHSLYKNNYRSNKTRHWGVHDISGSVWRRNPGNISHKGNSPEPLMLSLKLDSDKIMTSELWWNSGVRGTKPLVTELGR